MPIAACRLAVRAQPSVESPLVVARSVVLGVYQKGQFSWDEVGGIFPGPGWAVFS